MNKSFDFTSVPKELIYRDRQYLDDFGVENRASLNYYIYEEIYDRFSHFADFEEFATDIFNCSYYICTMAIVDHHSERRFGAYLKEIFSRFRYDKTYSGIILSMVLLQIRIQRWDITPNIIRLADSIEKELKKEEYRNLFNDFYLRIRVRMSKISPENLERAPFEEFLPREIDRKVLMDTCSYWDWCHEFGTDEEKKLEFIQAIGKNEKERMIIAQFLREQTQLFFAEKEQTKNADEKSASKETTAYTNLQLQDKDEEIRLLKEELKIYQQEPISDDPHNKVRLEAFYRLLEEIGVDFNGYGIKARAARLAEYITGIPIAACSNHATLRKSQLNPMEHDTEVKKVNEKLSNLGLNCLVEI